MPKASATIITKAKPSLLKASKSNEGLEVIITQKLGDLEKQLDCSLEELAHWQFEHQHIAVPTMLILLRTAVTYSLDPTLGQIIFIELDGQLKPYITINGWIAIIHRQAQFNGVQFQYSSTEKEGIPAWVQCTIWRKDCQEPIRTREYYQDMQSSDSAVKEMPIRVLRNRALSACARLAFGITIPELYRTDAKSLDKNNHPELPNESVKSQSPSRTLVKSESPLGTLAAIGNGPKTRSALLKIQLQSNTP